MIFLSPVIAGAVAALVGTMSHSAPVGFATLVVLAVFFIALAVRSRRAASPAGA